MKEPPNKPDAVNPAMALRFAVEDQWRRVTDLERSAVWMSASFSLDIASRSGIGCAQRYANRD